jgi:hypothetical protein
MLYVLNAMLLPAGAVTVTVKTSGPTTAVSPYIYGTNEGDWAASGKYLTLGRQGGNRMTAYNWENNASNAGSDWYNQNDNFLGGGTTAGEVPRAATTATLKAGKGTIVTIPMAGYVAADKNGGGDVNQTADYLNVRFRISKPRKGTKFVFPPSLSDGYVYQDEFVSWLEKSFKSRSSSTPIFYSLDNEPDLWAFTHSRIHPEKASYAEMVDKSTNLASAIKAVASKAVIFGFVSYGFTGYKSLQDAPDAQGRDFINYYLDSMKLAEKHAGKRLLDVLDLHWYSEAQGGGQRITGNDTSPASVAARVQAPRSLWDSAYTEDSWITQYGTNGPIRLIPAVKSQIAAHYPGTKLAFTEYNYGGSNHISGAIAQADALGIFGREGVFAACLWPLSGDNSFIHAAFDAFRNYDGKGARFGDAGLLTTSSRVADVTAYASKAASGGGYVVVLINKATDATTVVVNVDAKLKSIKAYSLAGTNPHLVAANLGSVSGKAANLTLPALSVNTVLLK